MSLRQPSIVHSNANLGSLPGNIDATIIVRPLGRLHMLNRMLQSEELVWRSYQLTVVCSQGSEVSGCGPPRRQRRATRLALMIVRTRLLRIPKHRCAGTRLGSFIAG